MTSPINEYDENPSEKRLIDLRQYAIDLEVEKDELTKILDPLRRAPGETNAEVCFKLRKFYTHDKPRYKETLKVWAEALDNIKKKAGDIQDDVRTALGD